MNTRLAMLSMDKTVARRSESAISRLSSGFTSRQYSPPAGGLQLARADRLALAAHQQRDQERRRRHAGRREERQREIDHRQQAPRGERERLAGEVPRRRAALVMRVVIAAA